MRIRAVDSAAPSPVSSFNRLNGYEHYSKPVKRNSGSANGHNLFLTSVWCMHPKIEALSYKPIHRNNSENEPSFKNPCKPSIFLYGVRKVNYRIGTELQQCQYNRKERRKKKIQHQRM
mmetsp:Transcript_605/g.945  ORF Transcript_605/g.945 Transcript_605/m.945 type:complete len:118 (+) Transcript_605:471-824(+)